MVQLSKLVRYCSYKCNDWKTESRLKKINILLFCVFPLTASSFFFSSFSSEFILLQFYFNTYWPYQLGFHSNSNSPYHPFSFTMLETSTINNRQLEAILHQHQTTINNIQATLAYIKPSLTLNKKNIVNINTVIVDIRTFINHIIHSLSKITTKLDFQIILPLSLPLSPLYVVGSTTPSL